MSPQDQEVEWADEPNLEDVTHAAKSLRELIDTIRTQAQSAREEEVPDTLNALTKDLEPLTFCLAESTDELEAVRHGRHPSLILLWLRALERVSCFVQVLYDFANIAKLRDAHRGKVPRIFNHDMGPVFVRNMQSTKKLLSSKEFYLAWADVLRTLDRPDWITSARVFIKRILLDIEALEHDLPPPSYVKPGFYSIKIQAMFPPAFQLEELSHDLQKREIPGMFPDESSPSPQDVLDPIQITYGIPAQGRGGRGRSHRPGSGAVPRQSPAHNIVDSLGSTSRLTSGKISKSAGIRVKAKAEASLLQRLSRAYQNSDLFRALRDQLSTGSVPRKPHDHRFAFTGASAMRKRASQVTPPRLKSRTARTVHFSETALSPPTPSRDGLEIPNGRDPASPRQSLSSLFTGHQQPLAGEQTPPSPSPSPEQRETTAPQRITSNSDDVANINWGLEDLNLEDTSSRRINDICLTGRQSQEGARKTIEKLLSEPSPAGLRQSDDSKHEIELRKKREAAEAAEAKRKAEEKARREAEERARRKLEERLAKSGGLRLPNQPFISVLSKDWLQKAQSTLRAAPATSLAVTGEGVDLRRHDFAKVVPETEWLNDEIVNGSLNWLDKAINSAAGIKNVKAQTRKCLALNSFFFKRLKDQGVAGTARTLSRNGVKKDNLLDVDTILLPICENLHWTLLVIRPRKRTIAHMDSLNPRGSQANTNLALAWMKEVLQEKYVADEWKVVRHEAPRQTNGWDCGVHTITNAMCISLGLSPIDSYAAEDMPLQRLRIASILLNGGFSGDFDLKVF